MVGQKDSTWKHPKLWTEGEIQSLVKDTLGVDETFPRGYQLLILLWRPSEQDANGLYTTDQEIKNTTQSTMIGQVLRMGDDAFQDQHRFPSGPLVTYGEWAVFRGSERQRIRKNGHDLAFVNDDRFLGIDTNPATLQTHFDLQFEFSGH